VTELQRQVLFIVCGTLAAVVIAALLLIACGLPLDTTPDIQLPTI
jgi:hypothetical protein